MGNTPARAGTTSGRRCCPGSTAEHPRAGGDDAFTVAANNLSGEHPRAGGDDFAAMVNAVVVRGTPPRGRGRHHPGRRGAPTNRNTPARAGTTMTTTAW